MARFGVEAAQLARGDEVSVGSAAAQSTAARTLILFAVMFTAASMVAALLADGLLQLWPVLQGSLEAENPPPPALPPGDWYRSIIPANPIKAAAETAMVAVAPSPTSLNGTHSGCHCRTALLSA